MKSNSRAALLALATLSAVGAFNAGPGSPGAPAQQITESRTARDTPANKQQAPVGNPMRALLGTGNFGNSRGRRRRRGPGWTQAHVQRLARKARNVKRHRASLKA